MPGPTEEVRVTRLSVMLGVLAAVIAMLVPAPVAVAADNPLTFIGTPTAGAGVDVGVPLLITGGAFNGEAGGIVSVEISFDSGSSWQQVGDSETWAHVHTPSQAGTLTMITRASTTTVVGTPSAPRTVSVGSAGSPPSLGCPCFVSLPTLPDLPIIDDPDQEAVELGMRVRPDRNGYLTRLSVIRGTYTGALVGRVWSGAGTLLAEQTSAPGNGYSQDIVFTTPAAVQAGADYVVSYYTPAGGYAATEYYFSGTVVNAPLAAVHDGSTGAGVYHYGVGGGFPTDSWHDSNYWVRPTFTT